AARDERGGAALMSFAIVALVVLGLGFFAWLGARAKAAAFAAPHAPRPHSLPGYHGWYVALWAVIPALIFVAIWAVLSDRLIVDSVLQSPQAAPVPGLDMQRAAILAEARGLANGEDVQVYHEQARLLAPVFAGAVSFY